MLNNDTGNLANNTHFEGVGDHDDQEEKLKLINCLFLSKKDRSLIARHDDLSEDCSHRVLEVAHILHLRSPSVQNYYREQNDEGPPHDDEHYYILEKCW